MIRKDTRSGQTLLILILLTTVLVTIGLSVAQNTTQEANLTKVEEDAKKAFSAAEAALEAALQRNSTNVSDLNFDGISSLNAQLVTDTTGNFTTSRIQKDEQYMFYLSGYDETAQQVSGSPYNGDIQFSISDPNASTYCSSDQTKFALELTFVDSSVTPVVIKKSLLDDCSIVEGTEHKWNFDTTYNLATETMPSTLLIMRLVSESADFSGAKITVSRPSGTWPLQGRTLISTAKTTTGVEKKIKLFQSYPQIPADLFITSF